MSFKPTFVTTLPVSASSPDPVQARRNALRSFKVRKKDASGNTVFETQTANVRPSWRDNVFFVRVGRGKLLEFAKGQPGISFKTKEELVQAIDWVAAEVAKGTYDKQLEEAALKNEAGSQKNKNVKAA